MAILLIEIEVETALGKGKTLFVETTPDDNMWTIALRTQAIVTMHQREFLISKSYTDHRGLSLEDLTRGIEQLKSSLAR
jgi:hypothetical protein